MRRFANFENSAFCKGMFAALAVSATSLGILVGEAVAGEEFVPELHPIAVLSPSDVPDGLTNGFGSASDIFGECIVVGAPRDPWYNGDATGAVYVFRRLGPTWIEQAKLTAPDTGWEHQLGYSVAIEGDVIVAGAPRLIVGFPDENGPGAVYVFRRDDRVTPNDPWDDSWPLEAKLFAPDPQRGQLFGYSVAISGNVIVAGQPGRDASAEVYRWNGTAWNHESSLFGSDNWLGDGFGSAVDVDGNRAVVGAPQRNSGTGMAFVFTNSAFGWIEERRFTANDQKPGDFLGFAVSVSGVNVVIGAPGVDNAGNNWEAGASYVFGIRGAFSLFGFAKLRPLDSMRYEQFGSSVAIAGDLTAIGRWRNPWVVLFQHIGRVWAETSRLIGIEGGLARAVSIGRNFVVVNRRVYAVRDRHTLTDFASFQNCFHTDTGVGSRTACRPFDLTDDDRVDLDDFEQFMGTFAGP